jgi:hypothetical protein
MALAVILAVHLLLPEEPGERPWARAAGLPAFWPSW